MSGGASAPLPGQPAEALDGSYALPPGLTGAGLAGAPGAAPPAQKPMDPAALAAFAAGFQGAVSGAAPQGVDPRTAAAWAWWHRQQQWAAASALGTAHAAPPPGWPDAAASPWAAWPQAASAAGGWPQWHGGATAPAAEAPAAGAGEGGPSGEAEAHADSDALVRSLLRQHRTAEQEQQQAREEPGGEPSPEDAYAKDLTSAVQLFLAGGGMDDDEDEEDDAPPAAAAQGGAGPADYGKADDGAGPVAQRPPAPPADSPAAPAAADLASGGAAERGPSAPARAAPAAAKPAGPSPEGMQDFMHVLRQRPLPADITGERKKELEDLNFRCVSALYGDRIRPVLGAVQRRLREELAAAGWERGPTDAALQALLPMCARDPRLVLDPPMHSDPPVVRLAEEPATFQSWVDAEAQEDNYKQDMWDAFATYLLGTGGAAPLTLPSAPYAAAQELQRRQLPFFQGLTLGEMEHVVRLAIGKRRLLCHLGDSLRAGRALKPGSLKSAEVSKKDATKSKVDGSTRGDIRDLEDLTVVLLYVMQRFPEGAPLSLLKQHIQTHAHRTLSEADFKCSKLADIFKMAPLRNIFPLEHVAHRNEIVVVPPRMEWIPPRLLPRLQQLQQQLQPFGDAVAAHAGMGAELGPAGMPYAMQWGAMGGVPMQTQPGFVLGASTSMPPGWVMTPQVGVSTEDGAAGYAAGAWPRPW